MELTRPGEMGIVSAQPTTSRECYC